MISFDFNDVASVSGESAVKEVIDSAILNTSKAQVDVSKTDDEVILGLAMLSPFEYGRSRKKAAKTLSISVVLLDGVIKAKRLELTDATDNIFPTIEPWGTIVCLRSLLNQISEILERFIVFSSKHESKCIALWILHTYCIDATNISPIINISSPEKRCGKSTLLTILAKLVFKALTTSNITSAAIFRSIAKWMPTLIIDEADTFICHNEEMRGVINSGHTRDTAFVIRCDGDKHDPKRFSTWAPKAVACIGSLSGTIEDRSIVIRLRRKMVNEQKEHINEEATKVFDEIRQKCLRFKEDHLDDLYKILPKRPPELNDRAAGNWAPLFTIAELAGEDWLAYAIDAALYLSGLESEPLSISIELLQNIRDIFLNKKVDWLSTEDLIEALCRDSELPWSTYRAGQMITARQLAALLKEFDIKSQRMRFYAGSTTQKRGYYLSDCMDAFDRYIPKTSVTVSQTDASSDPAAYLAASQGV